MGGNGLSAIPVLESQPTELRENKREGMRGSGGLGNGYLHCRLVGCDGLRGWEKAGGASLVRASLWNVCSEGIQRDHGTHSYQKSGCCCK